MNPTPRVLRGTQSLVCAQTPLRLIAILLAIHAASCQKTPTIDELRQMQSNRQFAETLTPLRGMIKAKTEDPEVFFLYGLALSATGEVDAAQWPLRKAMESPDWVVPAGIQLSSDMFRAGNNDTAIAVVNRVLEAEPDHVIGLVLRARARIETRRNLEDALADADRALELDPDMARAKVARVVALLALKRADEAGAALEEIEDFSYAAGLDELESARFCGARASFAKERGEPAKADERYTKCLEEFPSSTILVEDALKFYDAIRQFERSIEIVEAALADAPESRDFRVGLALRHTATGNFERAEELLREGTEAKNPQIAAGAWLDLAGYLVDREDMDEAVEAMRRGYELTPSPAPQLVFRYADTLVATEHYEEALEIVDSLTVPAHRNLILGRVHLARGEHAVALELLAEGLKSWPENAVARYYAAIAAEGLGDFERSVEELRYSIRSGPSQTDARLRLAKLHDAEGAHKQAIAMLRQDIANHPSDSDMALLELEILGKLGEVAIPQHLWPATNQPDVWRYAIGSLARGVNRHSGPGAAEELISRLGIDFIDPANAFLLRERVRYLADAEKAADAVALAEASSKAHPNVADFHAILGLSLLRTDGAGDKARASLERALELEPNQADALSGLGQLAQMSGDATKAVDFYLRSDALDAGESEALEAAIDLLTGLGRLTEAEQQLEMLLEREPYLGPAALRLVKLRVARGAGSEERSRVLARLAMQFGGAGPEAAALLEVSKSR